MALLGQEGSEGQLVAVSIVCLGYRTISGAVPAPAILEQDSWGAVQSEQPAASIDPGKNDYQEGLSEVLEPTQG